MKMHAYSTLSIASLLLAFTTVLLPNNCCSAKMRAKEVDVKAYREKVKRMFYHAYDGYLKYAYPYDELKPLTCMGHDTWGSYSLTLIDAMDTLAVMGNYSEFRRIANIIIDKGEKIFDMDINVSVFETNIRIVGGLLSGHLLTKRTGMELEAAWPCSGPLLRMAESIARKLLPAFDTETGMPYGTVNLRNGVPKGETSVTCTAGVGTFLIEFGTLSRLTGDPIFEKVAVRAIRSLWKFRSPLGLLGNHIDVKTGKWTALDAGIGGQVDSYFEYLVKGSVLFNLPEMAHMFREYEVPIKKHLKKDDWYMWAHMTKGTITLPMFTSLDAFWPSIQMMLGDVDEAMKTLHNFHMVWRQFGFTPEYYNIPKSEAHKGREGYPLRPELIESIMYLYRATKDPELLNMGVDIVESIERQARTSCGYATIKDVRDHRLEDRMESFFLAETTKYLYLLFDVDNFIHNNGSSGQVINTPSGSCVIEAGGYVFNTEAHPIDLAAVHCCSAKKIEEDKVLEEFHSNLDLLSLFNLVEDDDEFDMKDWKGKKKTKRTDNSKKADVNKEVNIKERINSNTNRHVINVQNGVIKKVVGGLNEKLSIPMPKDEMSVESNVLKDRESSSGANLDSSLPSGPSNLDTKQEVTLKVLKMTELSDMERNVLKIFMDTLHLNSKDMNMFTIAEKLQLEFKDTPYEEIADHLAEHLLEEGLKEIGKGEEEEGRSDANLETAGDEVNSHNLKDEHMTVGNVEKNQDKHSKDLTDINNVMDEVVKGAGKIAPSVLDKKSIDLSAVVGGDDKNIDENPLKVEVLLNEKHKEKILDDIEKNDSNVESKSAIENDNTRDDDEVGEEDVNYVVEKLKRHLETQIEQDQEESSASQDRPAVTKIHHLENRRENVLSLTRKIIRLFSSLSSTGRADISDGEGGTSQSSSPSVGNLYASLGKYPLRYFEDPSFMHCPAQPFHSRLSVYGEFFVDE